MMSGTLRSVAAISLVLVVAGCTGSNADGGVDDSLDRSVVFESQAGATFSSYEAIITSLQGSGGVATGETAFIAQTRMAACTLVEPTLSPEAEAQALSAQAELNRELYEQFTVDPAEFAKAMRSLRDLARALELCDNVDAPEVRGSADIDRAKTAATSG